MAAPARRGHGPHHYFFTLYALDITHQIESALIDAGKQRCGHILAQAQYMGVTNESEMAMRRICSSSDRLSLWRPASPGDRHIQRDLQLSSPPFKTAA
jgi:hypothetical protein